MAERLPTFFGSVCYLKVGETPTLVVRSLPAEGKEAKDYFLFLRGWYILTLKTRSVRGSMCPLYLKSFAFTFI